MRNKAFLAFLLIALLACATAEVKLVSREFSDQYFADNQVVDWNIKDRLSDQLLSICGQNAIFGGINIFSSATAASKSYDSGVDHSKLYITFDIYAIDSQDGDSFNVSLDGVQLQSFKISQDVSSGATLCGSHGAQDRIQSVSIVLPHYRSKFTLKLSSTSDSAAENESSWGIRNLEIVAEYENGAVTVVSEEFMASEFVSSVDGWDIQGVESGEEFAECGDAQLFGGPETFGNETSLSKTYSNLSDHYGVIVNFDLWLIDTPDKEDKVKVIVDGQIYKFKRPDFEHFDGNDICGDNDYSERIVPVGLFVPHRNPQVTLTIKGIFNEDKENESFGIQNLRILTASCTSNTCTGVSEEFTAPLFSKPTGWKNSDGEDFSQIALSNTCAAGSEVFFGPHSSDIEKTFTELASHTGARLFFQVLTSGTWTKDTVLLVLVDNAWVNPIVAHKFEAGQHCSSDEETLRNYFIDVPHASSTLNLRFILSNPESDTSYFIRDVFAVTYQEEFTKEISSEQYQSDSFDKRTWSVSRDGEIQRISCENLGVFGLKTGDGEGEEGQESVSKTFTSLPEHTFVNIFLQVFFIDLENEQTITVKLDDQLIAVPLIASPENGQRQICGTATKEQGYFISIHHLHTATSLTVSLIRKLNSDQEKVLWGFDNVYFSVGDFNLSTPITAATEPEAESSPETSATSESDSNNSITASTDLSQCIEIFSECNYMGSSLPLCGEASDLQSLGWNSPIKSIRIPEGKSITKYADPGFDGEAIQITTSQQCLDGKSFFVAKKSSKKRVSKFIGEKLKVQKNKGK